MTVSEAAALGAAFIGAVGFWWLYVDRSAAEGMQMIGESSDPGRLGRSAYHLIHPATIAGIIATAAADELLLSNPDRRADAATAALVLGGTALYLVGHASFKATVWRITPWTRRIAVAVLAALGLVATRLTAVVLGGCTAFIVVAVAALDLRHTRSSSAGRED